MRVDRSVVGADRVAARGRWAVVGGDGVASAAHRAVGSVVGSRRACLRLPLHLPGAWPAIARSAHASSARDVHRAGSFRQFHGTGAVRWGAALGTASGDHPFPRSTGISIPHPLFAHPRCDAERCVLEPSSLHLEGAWTSWPA